MLRKAVLAALGLLFSVNLAFAEETSFSRVKIPDGHGRQTKAVLTFSDVDKAIKVVPVKGSLVSIPYGQVDRCSYEFTRKHRVASGIIVGSVAPPAGFIVFLTHSRSHWLEVDYHEQDLPKVFVLRMDKRDYLHVLDALKAHTGIEAQVLGNADKRQD
jgi:hypothetical protein